MTSDHVATDSAVSVIILTYNGLQYMRDLRDALRTQIRPLDEVIIWDNASTDGTPDWISKEWPEALLHRSADNLFFAAGNNAATQLASNDIVLYLNQDTRPESNLITEAAAVTRPGTAVTFAQVLPFDKRALVSQLDWSGVVTWRAQPPGVAATSMLSGAVFSLHKETLELIGGVPFDERIPHYCEDTNLSLRLQDLGVELVANSRVSVWHDSHLTRENVWIDFQRGIAIGRNRLLAFYYALGMGATLRRLPKLMLAGVRKARVDGNKSPIRAAGLTLATWIGYLSALRKR